MVTFEEQKKLDSERSNMITKCKCGHTIAMPFADRTICSHCRHWVYKNKQVEFRFKMLEEMRKNNGNGNAKESQQDLGSKP